MRLTMPRTVLDRIEARLKAVGRSATKVGKIAGYLFGLKSENIIRMMRTATRKGRIYNPRAKTLAKLAPVLQTSVEWLVREEEPEEVMPDEETLKRIEEAQLVGRGGKRDLLIQDVEGSVQVFDKAETVVDKRVTLKADEINISGNAAGATLPPGGADLLGNILVVIESIYKERNLPITLPELGRIAAERHASILAACKDPDEYPFAMEIMKLRIKKTLSGQGDSQQTTDDGKP